MGPVEVLVFSTDPQTRELWRSVLANRPLQVETAAEARRVWSEMERNGAVTVFDGERATLGDFERLDQISRRAPVVLVVEDGVERRLRDGFPNAGWRLVGRRNLEAQLAIQVEEVDAVWRNSVSGARVASQDQRSVEVSHPELLGVSPRLREVKAIIDRVASTDVTILIRGESGTGKELVARAIHRASLRGNKPYVTVLCPAIPEGLLESELFGYEKGSFTGAFRRQPGKFEIANNGTVFLDEIGDIPFGLQAKLLHVLQGGAFARLGGGPDQKVDVRILAATNKDLEQAVAAGSFREDLYYRLNVVSIHLPPLRERRGDLPVLVDVFLKKYNGQFNKDYDRISDANMARFMSYDWPGNIRELQNLIKRIVIMGNEQMVLDGYFVEHQKMTPAKAQVEPAMDLKGKGQKSGADQSGHLLRSIGKEAMQKAEAELILRTLEQTRWNRKAAARLLGVSYKALLYKIKQNQLDRQGGD